MTPSRVFQIDKRLKYVARDEIIFNPSDLDNFNLVNYIFVDAIANGIKVSCLVSSDESVPKGYVRFSKRSREKFDNVPNLKVKVIRPQFQKIKRGLPKVDEILTHSIRACPQLVAKYSKHVELVNPTNGYRLKIQLRADSNTAANTVYIDRYKMLLLGYNPNIKDSGDIEIVIMSDPHYQPKSFFKKMSGLFKQAIEKVKISVGNFFVGNREVTLRIGHIYPFDEYYNICRIHPNLRKFLGVEETDKLTIVYNNQKIVVPVLDVDPEHLEPIFKVKEQSQFEDGHLIIGISAYARHKLGIPNIGTSVKVRRSMKFILIKHINKLILPVLAVWFALVQLFKEFNWGVKDLIIASAILIPIVIYTALSAERAKIK